MGERADRSGWLEMKRGLPNNLILNGFDRSGTTAIARTAASHPAVELIMQPFNSGPIRRRLYQILDETNTRTADHAFFAALERGRLDSSYIESEWHERQSTVQEFVDERLHLLKTTLNHFTITWVQKNFPTLELWGVWREPSDILSSLVRNGFHLRWYRGAIAEITPTVLDHPVLSCRFGPLLEAIDSDIKATAFLIAARSYYYFLHLPPAKVIVYEQFVRQPGQALERLRLHFGLERFDFDAAQRRDLNLLGERWRPEGRSPLPLDRSDSAFCTRAFELLADVRPPEAQRLSGPTTSSEAPEA